MVGKVQNMGIHSPVIKRGKYGKKYWKAGGMIMAKLVAFYSRADENYFGGEYKYVEVGNTEKAARMVAEAADAELFKIEQKNPYAKEYKACVAQAREDFMANARPELARLPENLDDYEEIYLGYPNYCGTMPMAVYTFLEAFDWTGKTIHPFCTHEGSGLRSTEEDISKVARGAEVKPGLAIHGSSVDDAGDMISQWVK